jgi:hypothetical protein
MTMNESIVKGKTIYFTGKFGFGPQYYAEQFGATIVKSMSEDVDWVVVGPGRSATSLEQAQNLGIKVLDEKQFFELFDPNTLIQNERFKAMLEKWWAAALAVEVVKRATMPRVRASARIVTDRCGGYGPARLVKYEEFLNLTAEQLREAICNGDHYPVVARDEDGNFLVLCTSAADDSIDFKLRTAEILLYDDGSFDVVELGEYVDEEASASW